MRFDAREGLAETRAWVVSASKVMSSCRVCSSLSVANVAIAPLLVDLDSGCAMTSGMTTYMPMIPKA